MERAQIKLHNNAYNSYKFISALQKLNVEWRKVNTTLLLEVEDTNEVKTLLEFWGMSAKGDE